MIFRAKKAALAVSLLLGTGAVASTGLQAATLGDTKISLSGYIKVDAMYSDFSEGNLPSGNIGRDFYIPSLTPVSGDEEGAVFDAHARQSRFRFTSSTSTETGEDVVGVLEFDMLVTPNGDERISNSYTPRIRHAFIKYDKWLVGQTWTTLMDVGALPDSVDFIGNTDGTIFGRHVMLRYASNGFEIALENPETTVTPNGGGGRIVTDDNSVPDLIAAYTMKRDWGHVKVAGIMRQLAYDNGTSIDSTESGFGLALSGKFKVGQHDDIRFTFNTGSGLGRYVALNASNGAVLDNNGELDAIDTTAYSVSYRHVWNDKARSSIIYSAFDADNDVALTGAAVTDSTKSVRVNYKHSWTKAITVGAEYTYAERETAGGLEGDMNRLQFMAQYAF
ncbi:DcaP family trimeric outer membrane transporter [Aestuariibacter salexigens]|uniref:DcaP family trimeric outer membrane transporter n=1 Tax=Aestuariibacter salexigens TaxID=226010 RepID=UPI0003FD066D|nr:DcaP family trimeric outer membrane transporter [Aestuariibacter salexigens]